MKRLNNKGYIGDWAYGICAVLVITLLLILVALIPVSIFSKWDWAEENVSGIVYNTTNNSIVSGNTKFSIRAAVDTYVSEENRSSYCLPPNSKYKELINKAAADKDIEVQVTTKKGFWWKAPWTCIDNVTVTEVKE